MASEQLLTMVRATHELCGGRELSEVAATLFVAELERYDEAQVIGALRKCCREVKGNLTLADVLNRLDDGRPGAEEAWAMMPRSESQTVVWTEEMAQAWGTASDLIAEGETIPARMAFVERYRALVAAARDARTPAKWTASLGHDKGGREGPIAEAVRLGRLGASHAQLLLPYDGGAGDELGDVIAKLTVNLTLPK